MGPTTWDEAASIFDTRDSGLGGFSTPRKQEFGGFNPARGQDQGFASPRGAGQARGGLPADAQWGQYTGQYIMPFGEQQNALGQLAATQFADQVAESMKLMTGENAGSAQPAQSGGTGWEYLNQFDAAYTETSTKTGVPGNLIKAIQALETGRADYTGKENCKIRPEAGCVALNSGIFKATADSYGLDYERIRDDPNYAAYAIGVVLQGIANSDAGSFNGTPGKSVLEDGGWEGVARVYHGGDIRGGFVDENGVSSSGYEKDIAMYLDQLGGIAAPVGAGYVAPASGTAPVEQPPTKYSTIANDGRVLATAPPGSTLPAYQDMWGGSDEVITQGMGSMEGAVYNNNPDIYDYAEDFGYHGHPGIDIGLPAGTPLTSPISGTVVQVGGDYFTDPYGVGDLRIQTTNGDIIVFGHMEATQLKVGDMINAGDPLGLSGQSDTRPESAHLHLEVRVLQPDGTYRIADPEEYFSPAPAQ